MSGITGELPDLTTTEPTRLPQDRGIKRISLLIQMKLQQIAV